MYKRKDGYWAQAVFDGVNEKGIKYKTIYAKTPEELKKKIKKNDLSMRKAPTFADTVDEWYETKESDWAYNTKKCYTAPINRIKEYFGKTRTDEIRPPDIDRFFQDYTFSKHPSKNTARMTKTILLNIFKFAVRRGYTDNNPVRDAEIPRNLKKKHVYMPSKEEIEEIKKHHDTLFGLFMYTLLYTGLRKGEALALTYEDIDRERNTISVTKAVYYNDSGKPVISKPKTDTGIRTVPLLNKLKEQLPDIKTGYIFQEHGKIISQSRFITLQRQYRKNTGILCNPHQLRHAFATILVENDIDYKTAQAIMGHADIQTTLNFYAQIREDKIKTVSDKLIGLDVI